MFDNKTILITGGTGSFGKTFVPLTLKRFKPKKIIVFSRDEMKQWDMALTYQDETRVKFVIGDVRDKQRLLSVMKGVDYVVHAAATKIVPTAEYNPVECIKTNINGAMNVIEACNEVGVKRVVALSTDKASNPINLYGATKLASDKLFIASNSQEADQASKFSIVRYGNVMGSRGSVIPFFISLDKGLDIPITDERMTRFMISLEDGVELVWHAFENMVGGEIYVKKIPSMNIIDIAKTVSPEKMHRIIGIRPGEKLHEQMVGLEDAPFTYEYDKYYKILPAINDWSKDSKRIKKGVKVPPNFSYSSDKNKDWMTKTDLKKWIDLNKEKIGKI